MNLAKTPTDAGWSTRIPLTPEESARFRSFLKATGRKAGPWVRTLVLREMEREEGRGDGSVQAREMVSAIAVGRKP
jgi:hypothetical protein